MARALVSVAAQHPYPDFQDWWPLGAPFVTMMADAILGAWRPLADKPADLAAVQAVVEEYMQRVYKREARADLVAEFARARNLEGIQSGEFDALSYGFFRAAFGALAVQRRGDALRAARRRFTEQVGTRFFAQLADHLALELPPSLGAESDFALLQAAIRQIGRFLQTQGYLRSHFAFRFDVKTSYAGRAIDQNPNSVLRAIVAGRTAYALYEMGHPAILPSAVYLYQTVGEAQHHSSRTIEELFARVGCDAWETDDFDPSGYASESVVELWEIRRRPS